MAYGRLLGAAMNNPAAHGVNAGDPPKFEGQLPPPTGAGPIPTGTPGTTAKSAADEAILALRSAMGFFPSLKDQLEGTITAIKGAAGAKTPSVPPQGAAQPPGAPIPATPPTDLSGQPGPT